MANTLITPVQVILQAQFGYKADRPLTAPVMGPSSRYASVFTVGPVAGAGAAAQGLYLPRNSTEITIPASGTLTIDLASFVDNFGNPAVDTQTWTILKAFVLAHLATSAATGSIEVTGDAANALPHVRTKALYKGAWDAWGDVNTGLPIAAPNSKIIVANNDSMNAASFEMFLIGG